MIPMIKIVHGNKGTGKTKCLVADANGMLKDCLGDIVFINNDNSLITDLRHEIRYVNSSEFPISGINEILAFICGLIAENYDIKAIYLDGLDKHFTLTGNDSGFFERIKQLSERFDINFVFSINGDVSGIPDFVQKEYAC
jgi:hypothetical protein